MARATKIEIARFAFLRSLIKNSTKTVKSIANALSKDLQKVDNMGKKKASLIKKVLWSEYKEED